MKTNWFGRYKSDCWPLAILGGFIILANLAGAQPLTGEAAPSLQWQAVASSADGNLLLAAANTASPSNSSNVPVGSIYISTNAGATWNPTPAPTDFWQSVAVSANGAKMIAAASISFQSGDPPSISGDGLIYLSTNSGAAWLPATAPNNAWSCVASSADGTTLVAAASVLRPYYGAVLSGDGLIYRSTNAGLTWNATSAPSDNWKSIACSSDGTRLVAAIDASVNSGTGSIYISTNSGVTWMQFMSETNHWSSVACSADGTRLVAADPCCPPPWFFAYVYVSTNSGASWTVTSAPGALWNCVASSADGMTLAAASGQGNAGIFVSRDGGAIWTQTSLEGASWTTVACSADGGRMVAAAEDGRLATLPYTGPWRTSVAPVTSWIAMASSQDGTKLFATDGANIYSSSNSGTSWAVTFGSNAFFAGPIACSSDGTRVVAAYYLIYTSTNSGATWFPTAAPSELWVAVASSADGAKLAAAPQFDRLYLSSDSGATFNPRGPTNQWSSIACSADGTRLVAASGWGLLLDRAQSDGGDCAWCPPAIGGPPMGDGLIYVSGDSGATWTPTSAPSNNWSSVASSADGTQLVAAANNDLGQGLVFISRDSGVSWSATTTPREIGWGPVESSADGTRLIALATVVYATYPVHPLVPDGGIWWDFIDETDTFIYISTDSGATWAPSDTPAGTWGAATISADGTSVVALSGFGSAGILHWPPPPPLPPASPVLSIAQSRTHASLSWVVPSVRLTLQQTSGLASLNWLDITNQPTLNLNNLRNEVTLPGSPGHTFYRLKRQ